MKKCPRRVVGGIACRQMLMEREHAIMRGHPFALPCLASSLKRQSSAPLQQSCRVATDCFSLKKRFETDCALNRLYARLPVTVLPKKRHISLTPTGKSAFLTHFQRQARPCSLSVRIKEQRLAPRPRKATKKDAFISRDHFAYTL